MGYAAPVTSLVGKSIEGRYLLRREISKRSRTVVYEAEHVVTKRSVAIKMLHADAADDHAHRQALLSESRMLTEVRHPAIVEVLDAGMTQLSTSVDFAPFVTMELLEGRDLYGLLTSRGRFALGEAVGITLTLCRALANMHRWGVAHGDINPSNVFVPPTPPWEREWGSRDADAKLIGFGAAAQELVLGRPLRSPMNSASYLSPEQLDGDEATEQSDIYALAVVLYEILTDQLPLGRSITPAADVRDDVPRHLSTALQQALARDPRHRPKSAQAFATQLSEARATLPPDPPGPDLSRRRAARAPYLTPVRLQRDDQSTLDGRCEDISVSGMLVLTTKALQANKAVRVRFALPGTAKVVEVEAIARWNRMSRGGTCVVGLELGDVQEPVREAIERYVAVFGSEPRASRR